MPYVRHSARHMRTDKKAALFGLFLVTVLLISVITTLTSMPKIVLGTERNTDGFIEYLCLGRSCEELY